MPKTVCLEYHIEQCSAPCEKKITREDYSKIVTALKKFLSAKKDELTKTLQKQMKRYSDRKEYEKAILVKKRIEALSSIRQFREASRKPLFGELDELRETAGLLKTPEVIECFDVSNIAGEGSVGAMVQFRGGKPNKSEYRRFRIKSVTGIDDYSMIREIVRRRYSRLITENKPLPDLVLIDGGRGHLAVACEEIEKIVGAKPCFRPCPAIASIAKEHNHLYVPDKASPIKLPPGSRALLLIQRIRDEAHRFAITYHRKLRSKSKFNP